MGKLDGKTALVTGGSSGMAFSTARLFAAEGAAVVITGRDRGRLDAAVQQIGPHATGIVCDSGDLDQIDDMIHTVREIHGRLDVLFASAGSHRTSDLDSVTVEDYRDTFDVNVRGTLFTVQKALALLKNDAAIVLNASVASVKGLPGGTVYNASKAAVRSFARTWAQELAPRGIRVNVISPGPIDTPALREAAGDVLDQRRAAVPRGELGRPEEVATAVLFLACSESSFVNGVELFVDGGITQV